jgi:hypothetical protein
MFAVSGIVATCITLNNFSSSHVGFFPCKPIIHNAFAITLAIFQFAGNTALKPSEIPIIEMDESVYMPCKAAPAVAFSNSMAVFQFFLGLPLIAYTFI